MVEDDEEYSYTGYSADTAVAIRKHGEQATVIGDEEEYSFKGFDSESAAADAATERIGYGDFLIEEFSAESNIKKITKATHLSEMTVHYIMSVVYLVVGVVCVSLPGIIQSVFPYLVGGFMAAIGLGQFIFAVRAKEYVHTHSNVTATSLVMIALSILIMVEYEAAFTIIAIAWGLIGLMEGAHAFNHAFSRIARSERCIYYLAKGVIELVLAFLLLCDVEHIQMHIIYFGINLVFDAVTMFPPVKAYLSRK
ncbi:MAG: DUF308 domain-containing protein [Candidatus Coproplasma sp.]